MKWYKQIIGYTIFISIIVLIAHIDNTEEISKRQREQAILDYYQDTETLLDSLCISESDSIFRTNVGKKYLESKHTFETLIINDK